MSVPSVSLRVANKPDLTVSVDESTGQITANGHITPGDSLVIKVAVEDDRSIVAFASSSSFAVQGLRKETYGGLTRFQRKLVLRSYKGAFENNWKLNQIRLAEVEGDTLILWQVAVVGQGRGVNRELFLVVEQQYRIPMEAMPDGSYVAQKYWPQLFTLLDSLNVRGLDAKDDEPAEPNVEYTDLRTDQARVIWWNPAWGQGAAITRSGQVARVKFENVSVPTPNQLIRLYAGEVITYANTSLPDDTDNTGFLFDLRNVKSGSVPVSV